MRKRIVYSSAILSEVEESVDRRVAPHIILIPKPTSLFPYSLVLQCA